MFLYLTLETLLLLSIFTRKNRNISLFFLIGLLTIFSALRNETVGRDLPTYLKSFLYTEISFESIITSTRPLYSILEYFIQVIDKNRHIYIVITSVGYCLLLFYVINKTTEDKLLFLYLFFSLGIFLQSFCIIRQSYAILFILLAFQQLESTERKSYLHYYFLCLVAIGFHTSAIIMLLFPAILKLAKKKNYLPLNFLKIGLMISIVILISFFTIYPVVIRLFPLHYQRLYSVGKLLDKRNSVLNGILLFILYLSSYKIFFDVYDNISIEKKYLYGTIYIFAFSSVAFSLINASVGRVNLYFEALTALFVSKTNRKEYFNRKKYSFLFILFFFIYFVLYLFRDSIGVVPYELY